MAPDSSPLRHSAAGSLLVCDPYGPCENFSGIDTQAGIAGPRSVPYIYFFNFIEVSLIYSGSCSVLYLL